MRVNIVSYLACPNCGKDFKIKVFKEEKSEIKEGVLICSCGKWYPIISFILRILPNIYSKKYSDFLKKYSDELKKLNIRSIEEKIKIRSKQNQVKRSFSSKWSKWRQFSDWYKRFFDKWYMKKIGISSEVEFEAYFKDKKVMLDAGTGIGTKVETMCSRSEGEVFGIDLSESVETAYKNTKMFSNAHVIQADIFNLPFKKNIFDFIVCDGVLHHTPDPRKGFLSLVPFLANGGDIAVHIYKKMEPIREFTDNYIRSFTTKLSPDECLKICGSFTKLGKALDELNVEIEIPEDIPYLEIKAGKYNLQRFIYYEIFQCFWNSNLSFEENNLVNFDWFHPIHASHHTTDEVIGWFKEAHLHNIQSFKVNINGVSAKGTK